MELAKSQISDAEAGVKAHEAQLAACQQRLDRLQAEAQAAQQAADLVCNRHCHKTMPHTVSLCSLCAGFSLVCHSSVDAAQAATSSLTCKGSASCLRCQCIYLDLCSFRLARVWLLRALFGWDPFTHKYNRIHLPWCRIIFLLLLFPTVPTTCKRFAREA